MKVIYLGFNDPRLHARGVEYVIQSQAGSVGRAYYVFLGGNSEVFRWGRLVCISVRKTSYWPFSLNALIIGLKKRQPGTLVHAHNYLMALFLAKRVDIFTVHDGLAYLKGSMGSRSPIWRLIEAVVYLKSKRVHFISDYAKAMANPAFKYTRSITIYNTCPREKISTDADPSPVHSGAVKPYALIVRSIEERAGLDMVIQAATRFSKPNAEQLDFVIAGKGPLLAHYRDKVKASGLSNVTLLGYVSDSDLARLYQNARLTITPALYGEGFGLPVVESYFYGKEAIASDVCALPEVMIDRQFLFENTAEALTAKLQDILCGRIQANAAACRSHYAKNFGAARYWQSFKAVYEGLAA